MIIKEVERLGKHMYTYSEYVNRMGDNLDKTGSSYNKARAEFLKVDKDVVKITDGKSQVKIGEEDRPDIDSSLWFCSTILNVSYSKNWG